MFVPPCKIRPVMLCGLWWSWACNGSPEDLLPRQSSSPVECSGCHTYDINSGACSYVSAAMITFPTQASFQLVARLRGVSLYLKAPSGWLTLHQLLSPHPSSWESWRAHMPSKPLLIMPCLCCSLPTTSPHMPNIGQMCSFCCLFIFLEVVCTAYFPVSAFSFISLQFCYKIETVHMPFPFIFSKRKLFTALFIPQWKLPFFFLGTDVTYLESVSYHAYFISIFLHFQVPFSTAWLLHSSLTSDFSAFSNPAAWLAEQFCHICPFHPSTILSPARLSPSFWKWYRKFRYHRKKNSLH